MTGWRREPVSRIRHRAFYTGGSPRWRAGMAGDGLSAPASPHVGEDR
jgi:hypothetical protein